MSLVFRFELTDRAAGRRVSGLSRGNVLLEGPRGRVTSADRRPDQSIAIYLSLVDLLDGIGDLLGGSRQGVWQWVGTGSSFVVNFRRIGSRVQIDAMGVSLGDVEESDVASAVFEAANALLAKHLPPPSDVVREDLDSALEDFSDRFGLSYSATTNHPR